MLELLVGCCLRGLLQCDPGFHPKSCSIKAIWRVTKYMTLKSLAVLKCRIVTESLPSCSERWPAEPHRSKPPLQKETHPSFMA